MTTPTDDGTPGTRLYELMSGEVSWDDYRHQRWGWEARERSSWFLAELRRQGDSDGPVGDLARAVVADPALKGKQKADHLVDQLRASQAAREMWVAFVEYFGAPIEAHRRAEEQEWADRYRAAEGGAIFAALFANIVEDFLFTEVSPDDRKRAAQVWQRYCSWADQEGWVPCRGCGAHSPGDELCPACASAAGDDESQVQDLQQ